MRQHRNWISGTRLRAASVSLALIGLLVPILAAARLARARTFTLLHSFAGNEKDGAYPYAGLISDGTGNLYGTTQYGGSFNYGVVFKVNTSGKETVLHTFKGGVADGAYPFASLSRDATGNLYGTAAYGGSSGNGVVFKVSTSGQETVLYSFAGGTTDGCNPYGGVIRDAAGNLYGTTEFCGTSGYGTVFRVDAKGSETVVHNFAGTDGAHPLWTSLRLDASGNLYGVTPEGGTSNEGVVYELTSSGTLTVLHNFAGGTADGCSPLGAPAMDKTGNLYGTAELCGSSGKGIVWKLNSDHTETVLHNFNGLKEDGAYPGGGVTLDTQGNLYGDTEGGDASGYGTVYELKKNGTITLLHSFTGQDGQLPFGNVSRDIAGNLYGTTFAGGRAGYGTVWKVGP